MLRTTHCAVPPSPRLLRACALFGLGVTTRRRAFDAAHRRAARRILAMEPACIAVIAGPSGCGKSSLLRRVRQGLRRDARAPISLSPAPRAHRSLIDLTPGPLHRALRTLAAAGLADAALLARTPAELSEGERFRFRLALALARRPGWLLIDEFAASLDSATAATLCDLLRRHAARTGARIVLATPHPRIARAFGLRPCARTAPAISILRAPRKARP